MPLAIWGIVGAAVAIAVGVGIVKIGRDMFRWGVDQTRHKKPWERNSPDG